MLTDESLTAVKKYMRVEGADDDGIIAALHAAAVLYLENAGVRKPAAESDLYNLAVWSLTLHYYDHRDDVGGEAGFPMGLRPIINQLKLLGNGAEATA